MMSDPQGKTLPRISLRSFAHRLGRRSAVLALLALAGCGEHRSEPPPTSPTISTPLAPKTPTADQDHVPPRAPAQDLSRISRAECLRLALSANRSFRIRHSALERARLGQAIAQSQVYAPRLDASYTMSNGLDSGSGKVSATAPLIGFDVQPFLSTGWNQDGDLLTTRDAYTTAYGITVSRRLFSIAENLRQRMPISIADKEFYVAANVLVLEGKQLELDTTRDFFNIQRTEARERVRSRRVQDARDFLANVQDNVAHGFKAPVEELYATIDLNQAEADLLDERANVQNAKEQLLNRLAQPITAAMDITPEDLSAPSPAPPDIDHDVERVKAHHEDLGNRIAELHLEADQLRVQRDLLWPQVTAAFTAENLQTGNRAFDDNLGDQNVYALTLTYALPLDLNRGDRARYQQMRDEIEEKTLQLRQAESDLETRLRSTHRRILQLASTVDLAAKRMAAEEARMRVTLTRYKAGAIDNLEVTRAKQDLDNAEISLLNARIDQAISAVDYRSTLPAQMEGPPEQDRPAVLDARHATEGAAAPDARPTPREAPLPPVPSPPGPADLAPAPADPAQAPAPAPPLPPADEGAGK